MLFLPFVRRTSRRACVRHAFVPFGLLMLSTAALAQVPGKHGPAGRGLTYAKSVRDWHALPEDALPAVDALGHGLLVLKALNTAERVSFAAAGPEGGFSASDLDRASILLRDPGAGNRYPVSPRLIDLVFRVQAHFAAPEIRFLSGYRTPARGHASNHGKGRAIDFIVPGAADSEVAAFTRTLGFVGVGIYPVSGFVHLDVRERSYFWSDASGPGKRNRDRGILGELAVASDREAAKRGEVGSPVCPLQFDVDAALRSCSSRDLATDDDDDGTD